MTEKTFWRVTSIDGRQYLMPSDSRSAQVASKWRPGETLGGELRKPRNPRFHRLIHAIGGLAAENLDEFHGMDAHQVLKRLQIEANVGCDEMAVMMGKRPQIVRIPQSLSFASMGQEKFKEVSTALCDYLVTRYWPDTTVEEIHQMADEFAQGAI